MSGSVSGEALVAAARAMASGRVAEAGQMFKKLMVESDGDPVVANTFATSLAQVGATQLAERLLEVSAAKPNATFEVFFNLAKLRLQRSDVDAAISPLVNAARIEPTRPDLSTEARALLFATQLGRPTRHVEETVAAGVALADAGGGNEEAWHRVVEQAFSKDRTVAATRLAYLGVERHPSSSALRLLVANGEIALGGPVAAERALRRSILLRPTYAEAENNLAGVHLSAERTEDAERHYDRALTLNPSHGIARLNLAHFLLRSNQPEAAHPQALQAVRLRPADAAAHNVAGLVAHAQAFSDEAERSFRRALTLRPAYATYWINLASLLKPIGRTVEALTGYDRATLLHPNNADAWRNRGILLADNARMEDARRCFERALEIRPGDAGLAVKAAMTFPTITRSDAEIDAIRADIRDRLTEVRDGGGRIADPLIEVGLPNFYLAYHGRNDRELQSFIADVYLELCPDLAWTAPHCRAPRRADGRKLKVGFISRYFYDHSIRYSTAGIVRNLDRDEIELHIVSDRPAVRTTLFPPGMSADRFTVIPVDLHRARQAIAALELDVLIFADIGMEPLTYYLAFARLAPVQAHLQGHPVTPGIPNLDYFLSSALQEPDGCESHYREMPVRFSGTLFCYEPVPAVPALARAEFDLPEDMTLYFCPQTLFKFHPTFDALLRGILEGDPSGLLVLLQDRHAERTRALADRLSRSLGGAADRIRWVPRQPKQRYYGLVRQSAVMLDTTFFGGANTTLQSLGLGVPAVTLPGPWVRGRMTLGWLAEAGLDELIARDEADFVRIALACGTDPAWRAAVVERIEARRHLLFERTEVVAEFERFLRAAHDAAVERRPKLRWVKGRAL